MTTNSDSFNTFVKIPNMDEKTNPEYKEFIDGVASSYFTDIYKV
jgi:hypothetical protein